MARKCVLKWNAKSSTTSTAYTLFDVESIYGNICTVSFKSISGRIKEGENLGTLPFDPTHTHQARGFCDVTFEKPPICLGEEKDFIHLPFLALKASIQK